MSEGAPALLTLRTIYTYNDNRVRIDFCHSLNKGIAVMPCLHVYYQSSNQAAYMSRAYLQVITVSGITYDIH